VDQDELPEGVGDGVGGRAAIRPAADAANDAGARGDDISQTEDDFLFASLDSSPASHILSRLHCESRGDEKGKRRRRERKGRKGDSIPAKGLDRGSALGHWRC